MENETSFDLNAAIQRWRGKLAGSPSFRAGDLEELESHLRDSVMSLRARELSDEEAFLIAVRRTGTGESLAREFGAINRSSVWLDRLLWMTTGGITISSLWSLTTTLLFVRPARLTVTLIGLTLIFGLIGSFAKPVLRAPLGLPIAFLFVSVVSVLLRTSLTDNRMLGPIADLPYIQRLLLYNLTFVIQLIASSGLIALVAFKRLRHTSL